MEKQKGPRWLEKKLVQPKKLEEWADSLRSQNLTIATLNGSFDLLHAGHLYMISQAKLQADRLIVALNSDASIQKYKSPKRPIVPLQYRLELMAALEFVDFVTWFEETTPMALIEKIRPNVHVNGTEYGIHCIEADTVRKVGARLHLVELVPSLSTTRIIEKIVQCAV